MSFEEYLDLSLDVFRTYEHISNWTAGSEQYPIFCVKSEVVFEKADVICDFFDISENRRHFPIREPRNTSGNLKEALGEIKYRKLESILKDAISLFDQMPDIHITKSGLDDADLT